MQINLENYSFFIKPKFIDMRKGARTLAYIVQDEMGLKPFEKSVFVFCGKTKRIIKAIVWDENGWIEIIKRLESPGTFRWPESEQEACQSVPMNYWQPSRVMISGEDCLS